MPAPSLETSRTINGKHGRVFLPGAVFLTWVESFEARVALARTDVNVSGRMGTGYKLTGWSGEGTLNGFHVTSKFRRMIALVTKTGRMPPPTYLVSELSDPEQYGNGSLGVGAAAIERVTLKVVNFWEAPLGWDVGDLVKDDVPFTFEDLDWAEGEAIAPAGIGY